MSWIIHSKDNVEPGGMCWVSIGRDRITLSKDLVRLLGVKAGDGVVFCQHQTDGSRWAIAHSDDASAFRLNVKSREETLTISSKPLRELILRSCGREPMTVRATRLSVSTNPLNGMYQIDTTPLNKRP